MATVDELYAQGEKLKDAGQYEEAVAKFQEALQQDDTFALAHFALAVVCGKLGQHETAVRHAERGCELEPHDPVSYTALSVTCQRAFADTRDPRYLRLAEEAMMRGQMLQAGH